MASELRPHPTPGPEADLESQRLCPDLWELPTRMVRPQGHTGNQQKPHTWEPTQHDLQ